MARFLSSATNHYLQADSLTGINTSAGTIAVRMRPAWRSLDSSDHVIWGVENAASGGAASFLFERYSDNNFYVGMLSGGDVRITFADTAGWVQPQVWKSYIYQWDSAGSIQRCHIGGKLAGSRSAAFSVPAVDRICIGKARSLATVGADGELEDWAFWSVVLTLDEIQRYERGDSPNTIRPAARVAYVPILGTVLPEIDVWRGRRLDGSASVPARGSKRQRYLDLDADVVAGGGTVTGDGSAAGVGAASAVGAATAAGDGAAAGSGVALGVGSFTMAPTTGVATAAGTGAAAAVGAATAATTATASGLGQALGVGASIGIISAVGNAAGTSEALGVSPSLGGGVDLGRGKGQARRRRFDDLPAEFRDDLERWRAEDAPAAAPAELPPARVKLNRAERKAAQILARAKSADPAVAAAARARIDAMPADSPLARMLERQQMLDVRRLQIMAEEEDAVQAFMRWMMSQ